MGGCVSQLRGPSSSAPASGSAPAAAAAAAPAVKMAATDAEAEDVFLDDEDEDEDTLPHISDRENTAAHESALLHAVLPQSAGPSPATRRASRRSSVRFERGSESAPAAEEPEAGRPRSNSTSTIFVDSTVSQPNLEDTLRTVALALRFHVEDGHQKPNPVLLKERFDESRFPLTEEPVPEDYDTQLPTDEQIYVFLNMLFHAAALTAECGIITLVYINRAIQYTSLALHACNWKRVLLGAVVMASKVWDDQAVWNVDFCTILPSVTVEDMNELERTFLEMLKFNINVDSSVYTKYYFELRDLAEREHQAFALAPMSKEQATKLEAMSARVGEEASKANIRNAKSLDFKEISSRAILS